MGRKGPGATVKFTFEIEDFSFTLPESPGVVVSNEEVRRKFNENPETWKLVAGIGIGILVFSLAWKFSLPIIGKKILLLPAYAL